MAVVKDLRWYEIAVQTSRPSEVEKKEIDSMPAPVAYGYLNARRKDRHSKGFRDEHRHFTEDWSAFGKGLYGL